MPTREGFAQRMFTKTEATPFLPPRDDIVGFHRSAVTIASLRSDLLQYGNTTPRPKDNLLDLAISAVRRDFQLPQRVKMLHLNEVFQQDLPIWSASPGLPWRQLGYRTKGDVRRDPDAVSQIRRFWHFIKRGARYSAPDSLCYVRSHLVPVGESKIRAVWGYPATMTFGEAVFALPLIDGFKRHVQGFIGYGYETAVGGFKRLWRRFCGRKRFYCVDFKSFDKSVPEWLIDIAFDILETNVDFVHYQGYGVADARLNHRMWCYIRDYFKNTTIRLCNGERYVKRSGVASGSYFTQLIDSVVNAILVNWWSLRLSGVYPEDYLVFGDDSLVALTTSVDIDDIDEMMQEIGMKVNMKKSFTTKLLEKCYFLGYYVGKNGIPYKDEVDLLASLYYPEHPDKTWDDLASRALGIGYASLGCSDLVYSLCLAITSNRPYKLTIGRSMERYMKYVLGLESLDLPPEPPDPITFLYRLT